MSLIPIGSAAAHDFHDPLAVLGAAHERQRRDLGRLPRIVSALSSGEADAWSALTELVRELLGGHGAAHRDDEELSIFPRVSGRVEPALLAELVTEHRAEEAILYALRAVAGRWKKAPDTPGILDELESHARALVDSARAHLAREEELVWPGVSALPEAELRAIGIEMKLRRG